MPRGGSGRGAGAYSDGWVVVVALAALAGLWAALAAAQGW
jgi:hypothetical protein